MTRPAGGALEAGARPRSTATLVVLAALALALLVAFLALGTWQVERRTWKLQLMARVEQRVRAAPIAAPGPSEWPQVTAARDEYRRVLVTGSFLYERETLVQAATALGAGYWVLTPLETAGGSVVLVNRGFVPPERRDRATRASAEPGGPVSVTGLLRITEPEGGFLRRNDARANRWHSRDVPAIAEARGLNRVAPYFIDADAASPPQDAPVGGLTVTSFHNNHLAYAITWYALAVMVGVAASYLFRLERRVRRAPR